MSQYVFVVLLVLVLIAGGGRTESTLAFINGHIITLDDNSSIAEAMLVIDGRIQEIGSNSTIDAMSAPGVQVIDLNNRTVVPGFVDAHSHFPASGIHSVSVDLSPPPTGDTDSLQKILERIASAAKLTDENDWLLGYNYDNTALPLGKHPTRQQLDEVAPNHAVYLWHNSGHMGVANSKALSLMSINEDSLPPPGGTHGQVDQNGKLNGLLQETAAPPLYAIVKHFSWSKKLAVLTSARDTYLEAGVTTVQNGYAGLSMMRALRVAKLLGLLPQRIIVWPAHAKQAATHDPFKKPEKEFNYRVGAVKILVDGSPQGMTAFLSQPYFDTKDKPKDYQGTPLIDQQSLNDLVLKYHQLGFQLALHGNGDEAIEYIINSVELAQSTYSRPTARHILVHAQTLRNDQIDRLAGLSLLPSFFTSHTYYWGDWHRQHSLGPERAANISPAKWASDADLRYSFHADTPVTPINPLLLVWSATTRQTLSGVELGAHQRIDINRALRAVTIDAAWQNHVEHDVGSLERGKLADMVVLSQSPFDAADIRDIRVLKTYIGGIKQYQQSDSSGLK